MPPNQNANEPEKSVTPLQFLFLIVIFQSEDYISVDEILQTIQLQLHKDYIPSTGAIYKTLRELTVRGLVERELQSDKRIKHYRMTKHGIKNLREYYVKRLRLLQFMERCCAHRLKELKEDQTTRD